jgi:hypothetical protein
LHARRRFARGARVESRENSAMSLGNEEVLQRTAKKRRVESKQTKSQEPKDARKLLKPKRA